MEITSFFKRNWIHFAAIGIFFIVGLSYFSLQLDGYALKQHDIEQHKGAAHEIQDFREKNNDQEPLWTNALFGGMPATQISVIHDGNWVAKITTTFIKTFNSPFGIVLLYMLGFYFLMNLLKINRWVAIFGSLSYAFLSYQIVILQAGHNSKGIAIAFMAPVVGAFYMAFRRNWLLGTILSAVFMSFEMAANHLQVTYYLLFLLLGLGIAEIVRIIKTKDFIPFLKATAGVVVAYLLAFVINYGNIGMTNSYAKVSMRGTNDLTLTPEGKPLPKAQADGLDPEYVTQYSYGIDESFTFISPYVKGGSSTQISNSNFKDLVENSTNLTPEQINAALSNSAYWGDQLSTSGPVYLGVILVLLALLGMVYLKDPTKWALLGVSALALMLSWGKNYMGLTDWFLNYVPAYNKFRAVTIILVLLELTIPLLAALFLDKLIKEKEAIKANIKPFYITVAAFFVLLIGIKSVGIDKIYLSANERDTTQLEAQLAAQRPQVQAQIMQMTPEQATQYGIDNATPAGVETAVNAQIESMRTNYTDGLAATQEARKLIFDSSMNRSLLFTFLGIICLILFFQTSVPVYFSLGALGLISFIDVVSVSTNYLNSSEDEAGNYKYWAPKLAELYPMDAEIGDMQILELETKNNPMVRNAVYKGRLEGEAKANELEAIGNERTRIVNAYTFAALNRVTNYRVFGDYNVFSSTRTSYFHKALGGYHGAKLRAIQNMIEFHIGRTNNKVFDMFNVKYNLQQTDSGLVAAVNPTACGNAWFVKRLKVVPTADDAIRALGSQFQLSNAGTGKLFVNGEQQPTAKVMGTEKLQYLPAASADTLSVPLSNGIPLGVEVLFVQDRNGKTDLIMKEGFDRDTTRSFQAFVALKVTDEFNPKQVAIATQADAKAIAGRSWKADGTINMTSYAPNKITYTSTSPATGLAVFSEIMHPDWKATIDGKEVAIVKVNYLLRGLMLPAGKHKIVFEYNRSEYEKYNLLSMIGSMVLLLSVIGLIFFRIKRNKIK